MPSDICQVMSGLPWYAVLIYLIAVHLIEAWLGKTSKVKSGSILELIWNLITALWRKG